jgi:hypothetical protein
MAEQRITFSAFLLFSNARAIDPLLTSLATRICSSSIDHTYSILKRYAADQTNRLTAPLFCHRTFAFFIPTSPFITLPSSLNFLTIYTF